uniref:histone-arginine methyltransferase CARM1-like n=1 Tax=Pristiophorus japonicus TaxID=55135 RepID=UPI00398F2591
MATSVQEHSVSLVFVKEDQKGGFQFCNSLESQQPLKLEVKAEEEGAELRVIDGNGVCVFKCSVNRETESCRVGKQAFLITVGFSSVLLQFKSLNEFFTFYNSLKIFKGSNKARSAFSQRTEDASAAQYFQFYGCLSQQQNMMQDYIRTATYQRAILQNHVDFNDKVVLDVGCGSGILSFFAVQAGARKVYAVEASSMSKYAEDTFDVVILMARSVKYTVNFLEAKEDDLHRMEIPFVFRILQSGLVHGLAFWFDVAFVGSQKTVWLSTSPAEPLTHWYQVRCLLQTPLFAKEGETFSGKVLLVANKRQSYDIHIMAMVDQTGFKSGNLLDLKNPFFSFYE